jgi:hypothetical protein
MTLARLAGGLDGADPVLAHVGEAHGRDFCPVTGIGPARVSHRLGSITSPTSPARKGRQAVLTPAAKTSPASNSCALISRGDADERIMNDGLREKDQPAGETCGAGLRHVTATVGHAGIRSIIRIIATVLPLFWVPSVVMPFAQVQTSPFFTVNCLSFCMTASSPSVI